MRNQHDTLGCSSIPLSKWYGGVKIKKYTTHTKNTTIAPVEQKQYMD